MKEQMKNEQCGINKNILLIHNLTFRLLNAAAMITNKNPKFFIG